MIRRKDVKFETTRGQGPGGQHQNTTDSCVRATHLPTGIQVTISGRKQGANKRTALKKLQELVDEAYEDAQAEARKSKRDEAIKPQKALRTYDYKSGLVRDHRTGKSATIKQVLGKGRIDLLR